MIMRASLQDQVEEKTDRQNPNDDHPDKGPKQARFDYPPQQDPFGDGKDNHRHHERQDRADGQTLGMEGSTSGRIPNPDVVAEGAAA